MSKMRLLALSVVTFTSLAAWVALAQSSGSGTRPGGAKDSGTKDVGGKDVSPKDAAPKDAVPKDAVPKDSVTKDSAVKDSASRELIERGGGRVRGFRGVDGVGTIKDSRGQAYTGRVARVDLDKRTITLKGLLLDPSEKDKTADVKQFRLTKEALIMLDGRVVKLGAIKTDAYVQVIGARADAEKSADRSPPMVHSIEAYTRDPSPAGTGGAGAAGGTGVTGGIGAPVRKDKDKIKDR
jgi:hypothetical protein